MKRFVRTVGFDDGAFSRSQSKVLVVGTLFRGGSLLESLVSGFVVRDGFDSAEVFSSLLGGSRFKNVRAVFLNGVAVAGLNVVDVFSLFRLTGIPVIVVSRKFSDGSDLVGLLNRMGMQSKADVVRKLGPPKPVLDVFVQAVGIDLSGVEDLLKVTCVNSKVPEPLRVAHIIASGVSLGGVRTRV